MSKELTSGITIIFLGINFIILGMNIQKVSALEKRVQVIEVKK